MTIYLATIDTEMQCSILFSFPISIDYTLCCIVHSHAIEHNDRETAIYI